MDLDSKLDEFQTFKRCHSASIIDTKLNFDDLIGVRSDFLDDNESS